MADMGPNRRRVYEPSAKTGRRSSPRQYLSRSEQWRLLLLVLSLGLVLLAIRHAAKPATWYWMWGGQPPASDASGDNGNDGDQGGTPSATSAAPLPWIVDQPLREELAKVEDDKPFRAGEHEVFYTLLGRLDEAGAAAINDADVPTVGFTPLAAQPAEHRGQWVRFRGIVRRVKTVTASPNGHGITRLYQLWVQPDDDPRSVVVVYCTKLPDGFPSGKTPESTSSDAVPTATSEIRERVTITGVFLKRWPYYAQDGMRTAPLVLTVSPDWTPASASAQSRAGAWRPSPTMLGIALVSALVIAAVIVYRGLRRTPRVRRPDENTAANVIAGMQRADTSPDHAAAMRRHDDANDED